MVLNSRFSLPQLHPLLYLTASLIMGITWQATRYLPWLPLAGILILYSTYLFYADKQILYKQKLFCAVALCLFITGALRYTQQQTMYDKFYNTTVNRVCKLTAQVDDVETSYRYPSQTILTVTINKLVHNDIELPKVTGTQIKLSTKTRPTVQAGDTISCPKIYFRRIEKESYKNYLIKENLGAHVYTKGPFTTIHRPTFSIKRWLTNTRNKAVVGLKNKMSPQLFTMVASIFFGKKQVDATHMNGIREHFKTWGILHYLARSGLHLLIFILLWNFLMGLMPIPFASKQIILLFLIVGYMALSWSSISFVRALILFVLYKTCLFFDLQINSLYLLALTCLLVLLYNPFQLFFLDFQLSFALTFALAWLSNTKSVAFATK